MDEGHTSIVRVSYMELRESAAAPANWPGLERVAREQLVHSEYLALYRDVGESVRWDQRLRMPESQLRALLQDERLYIYVLRNAQGRALGFCEFDRSAFPQIELKNFGLIPEARGRGLGPRLLRVALHEEWDCDLTRFWLHTDTWDHPAAIRVYQQAGFRVYAVRDEAAGPL
jgi:ribosomal protein S18 acetylase RimI-like enzyme